MQYRREIDGLRALAVLPVMLFHAGIQRFSGGFVGVDVFFVISGYLITSILLAEMMQEKFSLVGFYERRARRILPALFFVMAVTIPFAWMWLMPVDLKEFAQSLVAVTVFASNVFFWLKSGYFESAAELKPMLHTWSLGVEEQYYILFPLFLLALWRFGRRRIVVALLVIAAASLGLAEFGVRKDPGAAFFLLPTRAWELAIGALSAIYLAGHSPAGTHVSIRQVASATGVGLIVFAVFVFDKDTPFPGLYALIPTLGAALVILFCTNDTVAGAILGSKPFVGVGLVSYSAYLWHQPLFALTRHKLLFEPGPQFMVLLTAVALILAYLSWRYVERPFRQREVTTRKQVFRFATAGGVVFMAAGIAGHVTNGFNQYFTEHRLSKQQVRQIELTEKHTKYDMYKSMYDDGECRFWGRKISPEFEARFNTCVKQYGKAVIVLGDSHAMNLYNIMAKSSVRPFLVGVSQGYCRITDSKEFCHYKGFDEFLKVHSADLDEVIYHQTGTSFLVDEHGNDKMRGKFSGNYDVFVSGERIDMVLQYLHERSRYVKLVWAGPWIEAQAPSSLAPYERFTINSYSYAKFHDLDVALKERVLSRSGSLYRYVSLVDEFALTEDSLWRGDCLLYRDENHFSRCGEDLLAADHRAFWGMLASLPPKLTSFVSK